MTAQLSKKAEAWSARFTEPVSDLVKRYTASVFFDKRLAPFDIQGSLAHAEMLAAQGIISAQDRAEIERGMAQIRSEIEAGSFEWLLDLEDVHLNIEKRLTELVGDAGKRLHTGRSRNDQVATDIRLYVRAAALQGYATATDLADYLVKKGLPFRDAHEAVAHAVRACDDLKCDLSDMPLEKLREFSPLIEQDVFAVLTLEGSVAARDHVGGTAPNQVRAAIARVRKLLAE